MSDWDPARYGAFRALRLRPALDLLAQVPALPEGGIVDLGCGVGAVAPALAARFAGRRRVGVDTSAAMLAKAAGQYDQLFDVDITVWRPDQPVALIFSNAALNWVPDHATLMPRLAQMLLPGGVLAVQMPRQDEAPSHRLLREVAERLFPGRFPAHQVRVLAARAYAEMLAPLGDVTVWSTDYLQILDPAPQGHPVRAFTASTAMRPFLQAMTPEEQAGYVAAYDRALHPAYPALPDGRVPFPFTRVFFILRRP